MKLVHISDIHIHPQPIHGRDPLASFRACLDHVEAHDPDADKVVITGDLTHCGDEDSYRTLASVLANSPLKDKLSPRLMIGNHDDRETFATVFPDVPRDPSGFVQWTEMTPQGLFVYMDTVDQGRQSGLYCEARMAWLSAVLEDSRAKGQRAYLFMHHNPVRVHVANADIIGLFNLREVQALLKSFSDVIAHIFFGHCHYSLSGSLGGISYSAPRSTNHPSWPDFSGPINRSGHGDLSPNYNVCFLGDDSTVVHSVDFLDAATVEWTVADDTLLTRVRI